MRRRFRLILIGALILLAAVTASLLGSYVAVEQASSGRLYDEQTIKAVPNGYDVGLVLGVSERLGSGWLNPYFTHRITAATALYKAGKVKHLLVSGDNSRKDYDEPALMRAALIKNGVPASAISVDCAGFRTLDSIVRAKEVFGLQRFIVISQCFHDKRALFIARHYHLDALGFCAEDVALNVDTRTPVREAFARVKMALDLYFLNTQPKFLGPRISLPCPTPD